MTLYLFNSPVVTTPGMYRFRPMSVAQARRLAARGTVSAIGHAASAELLSELLGIEVPMRRMEVRMRPGDEALVLRLLRRLPEGRVLGSRALRRWPHAIARLTRVG